jgi:hypothetical protein
MEDISKLEKIEILFKEYDFMKLKRRTYYGGEYNNEALHFCLLLNQYDTVDSIQVKAWETFYKYFCTDERFYNLYKKKIGLVFKDSKEEAIKKIGTVDSFLEFSKKVKEILDG